MSLETNHGHEQVDTSAGYERRDVNVRALLQFGFWMAVVLFITFLGMRWTFRYFSGVETPGLPISTISETPRVLPPSPRLQVTPHQDLEAYCKGQQERVETYGWVDQGARVVRIPVDRAIDLVLQRGLPTRSGTSTDGIADVTPPPPVVAGGADLEGPCGYLAPDIGGPAPAPVAAEK